MNSPLLPAETSFRSALRSWRKDCRSLSLSTVATATSAGDAGPVSSEGAVNGRRFCCYRRKCAWGGSASPLIEKCTNLFGPLGNYGGVKWIVVGRQSLGDLLETLCLIAFEHLTSARKVSRRWCPHSLTHSLPKITALFGGILLSRSIYRLSQVTWMHE